jgi:hypothetical protein
VVTGGSHWLATRVCTHDSRRSSQRWPLHLEWWSLPSASIGSCFRFWSTRTMWDPRSLNFGSGDVNVLLALQMCRSNRLDMVNWGSLSQLELPVKSFNFRITRSYAGYTSISAQISIKQSGWAELGRRWAWDQSVRKKMMATSRFAQFFDFRPVLGVSACVSHLHQDQLNTRGRQRETKWWSCGCSRLYVSLSDIRVR